MTESADPKQPFRQPLAPKRILLAVGGGIAAYKSATLCSRLAQAGHHVQAAMTHSATEFLGAATLTALSGRPVAIASFDKSHPLGPHIEHADGVDLMIVAPATANLIAKFAHGIADDLISTLYLQNLAPVLIAPAMSDPMWSKPSVQRNIAQLAEDGCHLVGPESGWLSCRVRGTGRMSEPETILAHAMDLLVSRNHLASDQPSDDGS
ncbi:flavoprotein [Rhodopirellula sp. MGV]|uniref:flavoprotein n=1 Tax=Rhodopirellula sp. MGV TaxID=2023130 RepID=UPI000B95CCBA|nr:flavoprotein [Rhodopirellula sp. MGV]OYP38266.1 phosphopantothenoylcysteine decarboxylase [Rhodopirellula sp. MGV]PNY38604.1 phosphopantothenoylcysteine decarboxylase [Rhodopirellula baltica]